MEWQVFGSQNWFHVKSECQWNSWISTLCWCADFHYQLHIEYDTRRSLSSFLLTSSMCHYAVLNGNNHGPIIFLWGTMLQKLSKCEVKAWLGWNLLILQPLRFYVKSNLANSNSPKMLILTIWDSEFWFLVNLSTLQVPNLLKFKVQSVKSCQKWHLCMVWLYQNLISRKIRVAVKWSNFNKVKPSLHILKVSGV